MGSRGASSYTAEQREAFSFAPKYMWKYLAERQKTTNAVSEANEKIRKELEQSKEHKEWTKQNEVYEKAVSDYVAKNVTKRTPNAAKKKANKIWEEKVLPKQKKLEKKYELEKLYEKMSKAEEAVQKNKPKVK